MEQKDCSLREWTSLKQQRTKAVRRYPHKMLRVAANFTRAALKVITTYQLTRCGRPCAGWRVDGEKRGMRDRDGYARPVPEPRAGRTSSDRIAIPLDWRPDARGRAGGFLFLWTCIKRRASLFPARRGQPHRAPCGVGRFRPRFCDA